MNSVRALASAALISLATSGFAVETQPTGEVQVQASYYQPKLDDNKSHWALEMPETVVGLLAYEDLDSIVIMGVVDADVSVQADEDAEVALRQAYLSMTQSTFSLSAGQLKTLEQSYLIDSASYVKSLERGGCKRQRRRIRLNPMLYA